MVDSSTMLDHKKKVNSLDKFCSNNAVHQDPVYYLMGEDLLGIPGELVYHTGYSPWSIFHYGYPLQYSPLGSELTHKYPCTESLQNMQCDYNLG